MKRFLLIVALVLSCALPAYSASHTTLTYHESTLTFRGVIDTQTVSSIRSALNSGKYDTLNINSPGGMASSGYVLGDVIQNANVKVVVSHGSICLSACAYAALGAHTLTIDGMLAIHTPYVTTMRSNETLGDLSAQNAGAIASMVWYVSSKGYGVRFIYEITNRTAPDSYMQFSTQQDLDEFKVDSFLTDTDKYDTLYEIITDDDVVQYLRSKG